MATSIGTLRERLAPGASAVLVLSVGVVTIMLTWTYLGMRSVMDIGGYCASGGPYEIAVQCPDGAWMISVAVPVMILATFVGSGAAVPVKAPTLIFPMWAALFGALGWNFLEYAFSGPSLVVSWLICGVMFWLMAAPAVALIAVWLKNALLTRDPEQIWWIPVYAVLIAMGIGLGWWSFTAWS